MLNSNPTSGFEPTGEGIHGLSDVPPPRSGDPHADLGGDDLITVVQHPFTPRPAGSLATAAASPPVFPGG